MIKKFQKTGSIFDRPHSWQPKVLPAPALQQIDSWLTGNNEVTNTELVQKLRDTDHASTVSRATVGRTRISPGVEFCQRCGKLWKLSHHNLHWWEDDSATYVLMLAFNVHNYSSFNSNCTRSTSHHKLVHKVVRTNVTKNSYFYRLPCLWNAVPSINLNLSFTSIKSSLKLFFWNHFVNNFDPNNSCTLHFLCPCHKCVCTEGHSFK